jgi:hypothetical protein
MATERIFGLLGINFPGISINIIFKVTALLTLVNIFMKYICNNQKHSERKDANKVCGIYAFPYGLHVSSLVYYPTVYVLAFQKSNLDLSNTV